MAFVLRRVVVALAAVFLLATGLSVADLAEGDVDAGDAIALRVATKAVPDHPMRVPRPVPLTAFASFFGMATVVAAWVLDDGLVGRRHRRIGDVGDDWRCLLVGAPPAAS